MPIPYHHTGIDRVRLGNAETTGADQRERVRSDLAFDGKRERSGLAGRDHVA